MIKIRDLLVAIKVSVEDAGAKRLAKVLDDITKSGKSAGVSLDTTSKAANKAAREAERAAAKIEAAKRREARESERADRVRAREAERAAATIERAKARETRAHEKALADLKRATDRSVGEIRRLSRANQDRFERLGDIRAQRRGELREEFMGPRTTVREGLAGAGRTLATGAGLFVGGLAAAGGFALGRAGEMESIRAMLTVQEGGAAAAEDTFSRIKGLAQDLPSSVEEVTRSLVKLRGAGLETTNEALTKHSDIAASAGKTIAEWSEAVLDATMGERERLKEFQIQSKDLGDQVAFTFKGQTTVIEDNQKAVEQYLLSLGDLPGIAGASAAQMNTLKGVISNFGDAFTNAIDEAMQSTGALEEAKGLLRDLSGGAGGLAEAFGTVLADGLRTLREWLANITAEDMQGWLDRAVEAGEAMIDMLGRLLDLAKMAADAFSALAEWNDTLALSFAALIAAGGGLPGLFAATAVAAASFSMAVVDAADGASRLRNQHILLMARLKADLAELAAHEAEMRGKVASEVAGDEERLRQRQKGARFGREGEASIAEAQFNAAAEANRAGFGEEFFATAEQQAGGKSIAATGTAEQAALARAGGAAGLGGPAARAKLRLDQARAAELDKVRRSGGDVASREAGLAAADTKARKAFTDAMRKGASEGEAIAAAERALLSTKAPKGGRGRGGGKAKEPGQMDILEQLGLKGPGSLLENKPSPQSLTISTTIVLEVGKDMQVDVTMPAGATFEGTAEEAGRQVGETLAAKAAEIVKPVIYESVMLLHEQLAKRRGGGRVPISARKGGAS